MKRVISKRKYSVVLLMLTMVFSAAAETITLEQYLNRVQENHPFFIKEELKVDVEERDAETYRGGQEWIFSFSPSYSHLGGISAAGMMTGAEAADQGSASAGASRLFWSTGGTLSLGVSSGYTNMRFAGLSDPAETYSQSLSLSYVQPLLRNRGGVLNRLGYEISLYNAERVKVEVEESRETFLLEKARKYLDWALADEQIRIGEKRLELAQEQLRQVERRFASNLVDRVDVLRGEDAVRSAEQALLQMGSQWKAKQAELAVLAGDKSLYEASPSFDLFTLPPPPDVDADAAFLARESRVLKPLKVMLLQLASQRGGLEHERLSDLNLRIAGDLKGSDDNFTDSLDIVNPDVTISLEYSVPSGHVTVDAGIEKIESQSIQIREEIRSIIVELQAVQRGLYIQISDLEKILELGRAQIESARQTTAEELKLYNQGRGSLTFVIQSRDNEQNARLAQAGNAAYYHNLMLQYRALMDELAPSPGNSP